MTNQVKRRDGPSSLPTAVAALVMPMIAALVALESPRAVALPQWVPAPVLSAAAVRRDVDRDLALIAGLRDSPGLKAASDAFFAWNRAELADDDSVVDAQMAFRSAFLGLRPRDREAFLADRAERFLEALMRVDRAVAQGREEPVLLERFHVLAGRFETLALPTGLIDATGRVHAAPIVLRAVAKMRVLMAVDGSQVQALPTIERISFHGFRAAEAKGLSVDLRLRSIEELARLDPTYPAEVAAAVVLARAGNLEDASDRLALARSSGRRIQNHVLWLAREIRRREQRR